MQPQLHRYVVQKQFNAKSRLLLRLKSLHMCTPTHFTETSYAKKPFQLLSGELTLLLLLLLLPLSLLSQKCVMVFKGPLFLASAANRRASLNTLTVLTGCQALWLSQHLGKKNKKLYSHF